MTATEKARAQLETARAKLNDALVNGGDTRELRQTVTDAQEKLDRQLSGSAPTSAPDPALESAIAADARALLESANTSIQDALTTALNLARPDVSLSASLAESVIRERHQAAQDAAARLAHAARLSELQGRLSELSARRAGIIAERSEGVMDDARQGSTLALIDADSDGLRMLIERHVAEQPDPQRDAGSVEAQWSEHCSSVQGVALLDLANALQARLLDAAETLAQISGGRMENRFRPDLRWRAIVNRGVC